MRHLLKFAAQRGLLLLLGLFFSAASVYARGDKYFTKTDSDANVYVSPYASDIDQVAILPFKAPTELIGSSVSDLLVTEMLRAGRYTLLERSQMAKVLSESELAMSGLSAAKAVEVGQMIGADGVIIGTVIEYGTSAYKGHAYPVVSVSVRLIDTETSQVVWSADLAKKAESKKTSLSGQASEVVHEMMAGLYQQWRTQKANPNPRSKSAKKRSAKYQKDPNLYEPVGYSGDPAAPPEVPRGVSISDFGLREVTLAWSSPVDTPYRYQIERSDNETGPFEALDRVSPRKKKYTDKGSNKEPLMDSAMYYYRVLAVSQNGVKSKPSEVLESMTAPPPDPPLEIRVEAPSSRCVTLDWEPSDSRGVIKYLVERSLATEPIEYTTVAETKKTTFEDGGTLRSDLQDSTVYLYRIQAVNRVGSVGPMSKPAEVTTLPLPHAVKNVAAVTGEVRCVPLEWEVHDDEDIITYTVYRSDSRDGEYEELATLRGRTKNTYLDGERNPGSLPDATEFYYVVIAKNDVGAESPDSAIIMGRTRNVPPAVTGLKGAANRPREIPLAWNRSEDEKVTGYEIWRQDPGSEDFVKIDDIDSPETVEYLDRGPRARAADPLGRLNDGSEYRYKMKAFNAAYALSDWSKELRLATKPAPETPVITKTTESEPERVMIHWDANPEKDITAYELEGSDYPDRRFKSLGGVTPETDFEFEFSEDALDHGSLRYYRLRALDETGLTSEWSEVVSGQAKPQPAAPSDVAVNYVTGAAEISWVPSETKDVVRYRIYKKSGWSSWTEIDTTTQEFYELTRDAIGKKGTFAVSSVDKDDLESERSTAVSAQAKLIPLIESAEPKAVEDPDKLASSSADAAEDPNEELAR